MPKKAINQTTDEQIAKADEKAAAEKADTEKREAAKPKPKPEPKKAAPKPKPIVKAALTAEEAGNLLGFQENTMLELFAEGRLPAVRTEDGWQISEELVKRAASGEFKQKNEKFPAIFVPGMGLRLKQYHGRRMWIGPKKTARCPSFLQ